MTDKDARSRIKNLFVSYRSLLSCNGLTWLNQGNEKIAVHYVISEIRTESLRVRLETDLELSHYDLRKDFKGFMSHAIKLSEAFQLVDIGAPTKRHKAQDSRNRNNKDKQPGSDKGKSKDKDRNTRNDGNGQKPPVCLYGPHKVKSYRHYLKYCAVCPDEENMAIFKRMADEKAATGLSKSRHGKLEEATEIKDEKKVAGRMKATESRTSSSFIVLTVDRGETTTAQGHADDGSDESIVSARVAKRAVLNGKRKLKRIVPVT